MLKIELRDDAVLIDGYVNAVERDSKVLHDRKGDFIEKIKAGAFRRSLDRYKMTGRNVKVLLNHNYERELTSTADQTTKLFEDSIGLRCQCEIRDADVVSKAKEKKLVGWSFGFFVLKENREAGEIEHRDVRELDLVEVSILDNSKEPAYPGTSIEMRADDEMVIEVRTLPDEVEVVDKTTPIKKFDNSNYFNRYFSLRAGL